MITCEWYQLVYFAIITANKPTTPPDFFCISPFDWQQIPKIMPMNFSAKEQHQKLHLFIGTQKG